MEQSVISSVGQFSASGRKLRPRRSRSPFSIALVRRPTTFQRLRLAFALLFIAGPSLAAGPPRLLIHSHAHNDYEHPRPLFDALDHGFCSVEADIFLVHGQLLVAHELRQTRPQRTLQALYLDPLRERVEKNGGRVYPNGPEFTLLIDLKQDWHTLYPPLRAVLTHYADILTTYRDGVKRTGAIRVIITGDRSETMFAGEAIRYAALDGSLRDLKTDPSPLLVPWISADWTRVFHWNGHGAMPPAEWRRLTAIVRQAHAQHRLVRFWGAPDFPDFWRTLRAAGVDLINTDHLAGLERFFEQRNSRRKN
ncbi:MAG: phosphatidylinositol-specific phospholipase C/glycerophosphodiester phosphodiesterase family protein [Verrucomicrobiota bacterium]|nr:phosphatidylinositol-specific phospholipase C/glycerophosphodiester phosphodiesterase family protein [Verrucomicrobiota bacterium]